MTDEPLRRRAADGIVYRRVAKREPVNHETWSTTTSLYHWCSSETPEPLTPATPAHVCNIWEVSADQTEPEITSAETAEPTTDELIRRVLLFTEEQLTGEPAPLLTRTAVLALLQQAKQLEKIVVLLEDWKARSPARYPLPGMTRRPPADPGPEFKNPSPHKQS